MEFSLNLRVILLPISIVLSLSMIIYSWLKGKKNPTLNNYLFFQAFLFIWSLAQLLRVFAVDYRTEWWIVKVEYFAICFVGLSWLLFCLRFTESKIIERRRSIILLYIVPVFCYLALLTNGYHHLFFSKYDLNFGKREIIFWIHTIESYIYCLVGAILLVKYSFRQFSYIKKQAIILVLAASIPIIANIALVSGIFNPGFDITPLSFTVSLLFFGIAMFKYKLLNIVPMALRNIVDNMKESIMVTDNLNRIIDFNDALVNNFRSSKPLKTGAEVIYFVNNLKSSLENTIQGERIINAIADEKSTNIRGELNLVKPIKKSFTVNIQPILIGKETVGRVISFNDITDYKNLWDELHKKNMELSTKNQQLEKYTVTAEELAVTKERNRFARDVHDTLGQTMTLLITLLQLSKTACREDPDKAEARLNEAIKIASEGLNEVRRSLIGLAPENLIVDNLNDALQSLIANFQISGVKVELKVDGTLNYQNPMYTDVIYRLCQEALTNAIRHGKANQVYIALRFINDRLMVSITDNGFGCKNLIKGLGLTGMEHRITGLNGKITYHYGGEGFVIRVEIPF